VERVGRHAELAEELVEWREDLWQRGMTSRVVLVAVPPGWAGLPVLDRLAATAGDDDTPAVPATPRVTDYASRCCGLLDSSGTGQMQRRHLPQHPTAATRDSLV
jgi:hypothetical protein